MIREERDPDLGLSRTSRVVCHLCENIFKLAYAKARDNTYGLYRSRAWQIWGCTSEVNLLVLVQMVFLWAVGNPKLPCVLDFALYQLRAGLRTHQTLRASIRPSSMDAASRSIHIRKAEVPKLQIACTVWKQTKGLTHLLLPSTALRN